MHTFHFPFGDVTITLHDVALLLGLLCVVEAMGPVDIPELWRQDLVQRFAPVVRNLSSVQHGTWPTSTDPPLLGCNITAYVPQYLYLLCLSNIATTLSNYLFVYSDCMRNDANDKTLEVHLL
jgi:hypothetical protein